MYEYKMMRCSKIFKEIPVVIFLLQMVIKDSATTPPMNLLPQPTFSEPIPNVTVSAGRDVSLPCVIENLGSYRVAWSHKDKNTLISIQNRVIMRNSKYSVTHQNYKIWYLHLKKVDANDSGHYMCQINTTPMISQIGYLDVVVAPTIAEYETSSDTNVREGNDVSLKCFARGSPKPKIKWRREDDGEIPVQNEKVHDVIGPFLNITKVSRLNMGAYLCIASNGIPPSVSKRIMLNVKFPPMIWIPNQLVGVSPGNDISLDCHLESFPEPVTYWKKGANHIVVLSVPPMIWIPNQLVGVAPGNDISLDCHLESFPEPVTYWTKGANHIVVLSGENHDSVVMRSGMYKIQMRLRIRSVTPEDYGAYTCVAKNSLGETEGKIRLYEIAATSTNAVILEGPLDSSSGMSQKEISLRASDSETIPPVSANNWNSEGLNTALKTPTQKGSIDSGERNGARFPKSTILQFVLCSVVYVFSWFMERRIS